MGAANLEDEFARQIEAQIEDERRCVEVGNAQSPTSAFSSRIIPGVPGGEWHRRLEEAGLGSTEMDGYWQYFRLNELGRASVEQGLPWDSRGETYYSFKLCYARPVLKEIISYTEPADLFGHVVITVRYAITMEGFPEWATADLHRQIKRDLAQVTEPYVGEVIFVKTNKGWALDTSSRPYVRIAGSGLF